MKLVFHQMVEGNVWTYLPLFCDKEFLNDGWHKYTCTETCVAIGNARHGWESLATDIQSIREIDDSGCTLLSEIVNMVTNMTGSHILKGTGHTGWLKPINLSFRFILGDREPYSDNSSDSEKSEGTSDSEDDWESCVSLVEEDECFYDAVSPDNSQDVSYTSFPTKSLSSNLETNLDGLVKGYRQPSKSDQVPDLSKNAYLMQKSQVPEVNETYLIEGGRQLQNDDNHLRILSNMMEEETHVDSISSGEHEGICEVLFEAIEDQSEVCRRAERAISGLSQSNQLMLGKSDGEPSTPLPATNSVRQRQKVGLGNLSLNYPDKIVGDLFHDLYCGLNCVWYLVNAYVKPEVDISVTYSYDQRRHQYSESKFFDAAFSNIPDDENISVD